MKGLQCDFAALSIVANVEHSDQSEQYIHYTAQNRAQAH